MDGRQKIHERILLVVVIVALAYPLSVFPLAWMDAHGLLPNSIYTWVDNVFYAPIWWYVDAELPGGKEFLRAWLWIYD